MKKYFTGLFVIVALLVFCGSSHARTCSELPSGNVGLVGTEAALISSSTSQCTITIGNSSTSITPINQGNIPFSASGFGNKYPNDLVDGGRDLIIKPNRVDARLPKVSLYGYSTLTSALNDIGSTTTTLVIDKDMTVTASTSIPTNVAVEFVAPYKLTVNTGINLTINGQIKETYYQIVSCSGTANLIIGGKNDYVLPQWYGSPVDGTSDDGAYLAEVTDNCPNRRIKLTAGSWTITDNTTINTNTPLEASTGTTIAVASGKTLAIRSKFTAPYYGQVFTGAGTTTYGLYQREISPAWYGAFPDDLADDTSGINSALKGANSTTGGANVVCDAGVYSIAGTVYMLDDEDNNNKVVRLIGQGASRYTNDADNRVASPHEGTVFRKTSAGDIIRVNLDSNGAAVVTCSGQYRNWEIRDITFATDRTVNGVNAIRGFWAQPVIKNIACLYMEDCIDFSDSTSGCGANYSDIGNISRVWSFGTKGRTIAIAGADTTNIEDVFCYDTITTANNGKADYCLWLTNSNGAQISNVLSNVMYSTGGYSAAVGLEGSNGVTVDGIHAEAGRNSTIWANLCRGVSFRSIYESTTHASGRLSTISSSQYVNISGVYSLTEHANDFNLYGTSYLKLSDYYITSSIAATEHTPVAYADAASKYVLTDKYGRSISYPNGALVPLTAPATPISGSYYYNAPSDTFQIYSSDHWDFEIFSSAAP